MWILPLILLLLLHILISNAQYPWIIDGESLTYGQCASDSDCAVYAQIYPSQPASFFVCNNQIGRCQTLTGDVLNPAWQAACAAMTFSSITYRTVDSSALRADGIIIVNITNAPPPLALQGSLRLFLGTQSSVGTNLTVTMPFVEEQFVSTPNILYYFRNLKVSAYTIMYFDKTGCISTYYPSPVLLAFNGAYLPVTTCVGLTCTGVNWNDNTGFITLTAFGRTPTTAAYGVGIRCGLNTPWSPSYIYTNNNTDYGVGQRVPFAQIFDTSGGLLYTYSGTSLLWPPGAIPSTPPFPLGGVNFPQGADLIPAIISQAVEASYLSGFVSVVVGIGFAYRNCPSCAIFFIQAADGRYEGCIMAPITLDLSAANQFPYIFPAPQGIGLPIYTVGPMHFTVNSAFTNTVFMYEESNIFAIPGNTSTVNQTFLMLNPQITVITEGTNQTVTVNSFCANATVNTADVYLNYQPFPFTNNTLTFTMYDVTMDSTGINLQQFSPPQTQNIVAMPIKAFVYQSGFYCSILSGNLLEGHGPRPLIQSCFQVGLAVSPLTQVRAAVQYSNQVHYPYTPFAGFSSNITATFIVGLPYTLVMPFGMAPEVVLVRFSTDPNQQDQIDTFNGGVVDIFNTPLVTLDLTQYYTITTFTPYMYFQLNVNPYSPIHQIVALFAAGSVVPDELGFARLQLLYTQLPPPLPPPGRRKKIGVIGGGTAIGWVYPQDDNKKEPKAWSIKVKRVGRRLLANETESESQSMSLSVSQSPSQSKSYSRMNHGLDYAHENPETLPPGISLQYQCTLPTAISMIEYTQVIASIQVTAGICPVTNGLMTETSTGGFPYSMDNTNYNYTVYNGAYPPTVSSPPLTNPVAYYDVWTIVSTGVVRLAGVGQGQVAVPQNQLIQLTSTDSIGASSTTFAIAVSVIPPNYVVITFQPQVPSCVNNGTLQCVYMSWTLNNNNPQNIIIVQPMDVTSRELYDPNQPIFNLPANCSLLQNYTAYQVYQYCTLGEPIVNVTLNCTYCTNLPIPHPQQVNANTIFTCVNQEWWTVSVWAITPYWNPQIQRFTYCNIQNTISSHVPQPLSFTFGQAQRIPPPPTCLDNNCFQAQLFPLLDPCYGDPTNTCYQPGSSTYLNQLFIMSVPFLQPLNANFLYRVNLTDSYTIAMVIGNITFCPVTGIYVPTIQGPIINEILTTQTDCLAADGSVTIFVSYNNPNMGASATTAPLCMYWPLRHDPSQATEDSIPLPFTIAVNTPTPTLLPNANFAPETQRFNGIRAGIQNLLIYDRCPDNTCVSCLVPNSYTLNNPTLKYAYQQFTIENFDLPSGGIVIIRNDYIPAPCFEDTYFFNFSFVDTASPTTGLATQNYEVTFFYPFGLGVLQQFSACSGGNNIQSQGVPYGEFQVYFGPFNIELPTGHEFGLGFSGNYTFQVVGCASRCIADSATYINAVEPFVIVLSTAGTTCAYDTTQLLPTVTGGSQFGPYDNVTLRYMYPGSDLVYFSPYIFEWLTPLNPYNFTQTFLPLYVIPGNYTLKVIGPGPCSAIQNVIVESPPPITVTIAGYNKVCQTSNQSVIYLNVTGGTPPYRVLENITTFSSNNTIGIDFILSYNNTHCVHIIDSSDCIQPERVCFQIPDPGPVNVTLTTFPSCYNVATGSAIATSSSDIQCSWSVTGGNQPLISSCTLTNLPPSAQLVVTGSTIIGCVGQATGQVGVRPRIMMQLLQRTETGLPAGPCIDNITAIAYGGFLGPPYFISLFDDITNASITVTYEFMTNITNSTGNMTVAYILVQGVCRSYIYIILATEHDSLCLVSLIVNDPQFNFGSIVVNSTIPGLPPPNNFPPPPRNPNFMGYESQGPSWWFILTFTGVVCLMILLLAFMATNQATVY